MKYIKELDTARAIAVICVIFQHWFFINAGSIGVDIFFVLSGFLITNILLNNRSNFEASLIHPRGSSRLTIIWHFIVRRVLRIFPIYYLVLFIVFFFGGVFSVNIKNDFVYYLTYTENYLMFSRRDWPGAVSHLWTLAVEEQFYIIWPWLMIFVNRRMLKWVIVSFIIAGIACKYIFPGGDPFYAILTPNCFDAFGLGGLLAYFNVYEKERLSKIPARPIKWLLVVLLGILVVNYTVYPVLPVRTLTALVTVNFIVYCIYTGDDVVKKYFFRNVFLRRIGEISYGIYLYHNFIPRFIPEIYHHGLSIILFWGRRHNYEMQFINFLEKPWIVMVVNFIMLYVIAYVSFKCIESPILKLKKRFA